SATVGRGLSRKSSAASTSRKRAKADPSEPCHSFGVDGLSITGVSSSAGAAMRTLLLHNPTAGDGSLSVDSLKAAMLRSGCLVTACSKHDDGYKAAFGEPWDLVAVAGGDGTV